MLDKFQVKGTILKYNLQKCCILKYSYRDSKFDRMIHRVDIPNLTKTVNIEARIVDVEGRHILFLDGNLRKWLHGSISAVRDLTYNDYCKCISLLSKRLGVSEQSILNLEITYLEMGGNIKLPRAYERFILCLFSYPELAIDRWNETSVYFQGDKYKLIFYDKVKEMKKHNKILARVAEKINKEYFILRFEIKVNAKSGYRKSTLIQSFQSIRENWNELVDDWVRSFRRAKHVDLFSDSIEVKLKTLTKKQTSEYFNFLLINEIGLDRGLHLFQYFMKNRRSEGVSYIQELYKVYKTGNKWKYYDSILNQVELKGCILKKL